MAFDERESLVYNDLLMSQSIKIYGDKPIATKIYHVPRCHVKRDQNYVGSDKCNRNIWYQANRDRTIWWKAKRDRIILWQAKRDQTILWRC